MKRLTILLLIMYMIISCYAQDRINTQRGKTYECFITKVDSLNIYFYIESQGKKIITRILTDSINDIFYNGKMYNIKKLTDEEINRIQEELSFDYNSPKFLNNNTHWPNDYIYTFDGKVFPGRLVEFKEKTFSSDLRLDKVPQSLGNVAFFNNKDGFYANIKKQNSDGKGKFVRRISYGKINLYEDEYDVYMMTNSYGGGYSTKRIHNYYNTGFEPIKKAKYKILKSVVTDNEKSVIELNKFKRNRTERTVLNILSGVCVAWGLKSIITVSSSKEYENGEKGIGGGLAICGLGVASSWISYSLYLNKPKIFRQAIKEYNK